jgi:hypothetical protein
MLRTPARGPVPKREAVVLSDGEGGTMTIYQGFVAINGGIRCGSTTRETALFVT